MIIDRVENIISESVKAEGYNIVRIKYDGLKRKTLQIMIERLDGENITIDDCEKVNRIVSTLFIVDDPIDGQYNLEISSPGIDRPLVKIEDFKKFSGERVRLKTKYKVGDTSKFRGVLKKVDGDKITLETEEKGDLIEIDFGNILDAKLDVERFLFNKAN